jgi:hypothetical protein
LEHIINAAADPSPVVGTEEQTAPKSLETLAGTDGAMRRTINEKSNKQSESESESFLVRRQIHGLKSQPRAHLKDEKHWLTAILAWQLACP